MAKVLVIEDDPSISRLIGVHLEAAGFEGVFAGSAESAWEAVVSESPDCLVVDLILEGGSDGWALLDRVRHDGRFEHVPGVILTGLYEEPEVKMRALEYNCDVLGKPFDPPVLLEKLRALVRDAELVYGKDIGRGGKHVDLLPMRIVAFSDSYTFEGTMHLPRELNRFSEGLEAVLKDKRHFIPITDAQVKPRDGSQPTSVPFIEIAKGEIIAISPVHEQKPQ